MVLKCGDLVRVTRGRFMGSEGEIVDVFDPLDGGAPIYSIEPGHGDNLEIPGDWLEKRTIR